MSQDRMNQDRELEKYLQGKTHLSQLYADLPQVELPDHLDTTILAEAHRAVGARPAAAGRRRWAIPLGMAASFFVAVIAGLQLPYLLKDAAVPQLPEDERAAVAAVENSLAELPAAPAPRASAEAEAAPPSKAETKAKAIEVESAPLSEGRPPEAVAKEAAAPASRRLDERTALGGATLYSEKKPSVPENGSADDQRKLRAPAAAASVGVAAPEPVRMEPAATEVVKDEATGATLRPEDWLVRIQRLKQQGRLDEARKELAAFRKSYPDYRVPEAFEVR